VFFLTQRDGRWVEGSEGGEGDVTNTHTPTESERVREREGSTDV